jgi:hypothetical protein
MVSGLLATFPHGRDYPRGATPRTPTFNGSRPLHSTP